MWAEVLFSFTAECDDEISLEVGPEGDHLGGGVIIWVDLGGGVIIWVEG